MALPLICFAVTAPAAEVAVTPVGQTPDGLKVKMLAKRLKVEPEYNAILTKDMLAEQKVLIAVIGGSTKGLAAAHITREQEVERSVALLEEARRKDIKVLIMHIGGEYRRGKMTDMFIEAVAGLGDRIIVVRSGNADGLFTRARAKDAGLIEVDDVQGIISPLREAFSAWGVVR
jgi:hypothetical protein